MQCRSPRRSASPSPSPTFFAAFQVSLPRASAGNMLHTNLSAHSSWEVHAISLPFTWASPLSQGWEFCFSHEEFQVQCFIVCQRSYRQYLTATLLKKNAGRARSQQVLEEWMKLENLYQTALPGCEPYFSSGSRKTLRPFKISTPSRHSLARFCSEKKFESPYKTLKSRNEKWDWLTPAEKPCAKRKGFSGAGDKARAQSILLMSVTFWYDLTGYRKPEMRKSTGI